MRKIWIAVAGLALAGCATVHIPLDPAAAVARPDTSLVIIQRDNSIMPVAHLPVAVFVDGRLIGSVENGRVLRLHLDNGHRSIGVAPAAQAAPTKPQSEIDVSVGGDNVPVLRVHYVAAGWGGLKIEPMAQ